MIKFDEKVKFVAMDKDGKFRRFSKVPTLHENLGFWGVDSCDYGSSFLPSILDMSDYVCEDWTESLHVVQDGELISVSPDTAFEPDELILVKNGSEDSPWTPAKFIKYGDDEGIVRITLGGNSGDKGLARYRKFDKDLLCKN